MAPALITVCFVGVFLVALRKHSQNTVNMEPDRNYRVFRVCFRNAFSELAFWEPSFFCTGTRLMGQKRNYRVFCGCSRKGIAKTTTKHGIPGTGSQLPCVSWVFSQRLVGSFRNAITKTPAKHTVIAEARSVKTEARF